MTEDKLSKALEEIYQIITHTRIGFDEIYEDIKEIKRHQQEQDKQIIRLFNLYREIEIDLADLKRESDKIKTDKILDEMNEQTKTLEGESECEDEQKWANY